MCIYCNTANYRKIYENHYGKIPKEKDGRSYQIHHVDGNHNNNHYTNLICVTEKEHYDIHLSQGDWQACQIMAVRMKKSFTTISELARKGALRRVKEGTHNLLAKGKDSGAYKDTVYSFENIKTGEVVNFTLYDFCNIFQLHKPNICLLINGSRKQHKNWKIAGSDHTRFDNSSKFNGQSKHKFMNNLTKEIIYCRGIDLVRSFNLPRKEIIKLVRGQIKTFNDWVVL
jgi:hypothetical protein